jgi:hypothetical protein
VHVTRAVGREGIVVGVNLGGPEDVRIVLGAVDGIQESARLLLGSSKGANAATYLSALPSLTVTRATIAMRDTEPPRDQSASTVAATAFLSVVTAVSGSAVGAVATPASIWWTALEAVAPARSANSSSRSQVPTAYS